MFDVNALLTIGQNCMKRKVVQRSDTAASYSEDLISFWQLLSLLIWRSEPLWKLLISICLMTL